MKKLDPVQRMVPADTVCSEDGGRCCERIVPAEVADLEAALGHIEKAREILWRLGDHIFYDTSPIVGRLRARIASRLRQSATGGNSDSTTSR